MEESKIHFLSDKEILDLLFSYVPRIAEERDLDSLLVLMADLGRSLVQAERCSLWLLSENGEELWTKVAHGISEIRIPAKDGLVGYSLLHDEVLLIPSAYDDPRFDREVDKRSGFHTGSVLTVPFHNVKGDVMGVFQAMNALHGGSFRVEDLEHLQLIAVYSAKSVESAQLFMELQRTQEEITAILGDAAECRSHETGQHVNRVGQMCYTMGKYLGLDDAEATELRQASSMHDLGKLGIPDAILKKTASLSEEEYAIMKRHTMIGYEMLSRSSSHLLQSAALIARTHHERFDGKGYPDGISGTDIPMNGRICAIADVFDALTNKRCYKNPWSRDKVISFFLAERGRQFEPMLVDILLLHLDEFYAINDSLPD